MKAIHTKMQSLTDVQWALIGIGLMLITLAILAAKGIYKLDVLYGEI